MLYAFRVSDGAAVDSLIISSFNTDTLSLALNDTCAELPPGICYERAIYFGFIDLPDNNFGYDISWARCCRNASVINIINPNTSGTTLTVRIPPTALCDNSPVFQNDPSIALCLGIPFTAQNTAVDPDGDSISYHILTPYQGGGTNNPIPVPTPPPYNDINWNPPYNISNILSGNPGLSISPSGLISATPDLNGQFAVCLAARSWRNGSLLTEVRRDFQMNVVVCLADLPPVIAHPSGPMVNGKELIFYAGKENCYSFNISDAADNFLVFTATGDMFNPPSGQAASYNGAGYGTVVGRLCWSPDCSMAGYEGSVIISSNDNNNCPAPNYTIDTFRVKVIPPEIKSAEIRCVSKADNAGVRIQWLIPEPVPGFDRYEVYRSDALTPESIVFTTTDSTLKSWTDAAPGDFDNKQTYRIQTFFNCPLANPTIPSEAVSLLKPTVNLASPTNALITWDPYTGWDNPALTLWKNPVQEAIAENISNLNFSWNNCDFEGVVWLTGTDPISGCMMRSAESDSFKMYLNPPGIFEGCTASVLEDNQAVLVKWQAVPAQTGFVPILARKNASDADFQVITELDPYASSFIDNQALPADGIVEYRLGFLNPCAMPGDWSPVFNTFFLSVSILEDGFAQSWTPAYIREGLQEYEVQVRETEDPRTAWLVKHRMAADLERYTVDKEILTSRENHCYRIRAYPVPAACATESWSNTACQRPKPSLSVPDAFSPNGDGLNDFYKIPTYAIEKLEIRIFDRWGNLVFYSNDKYFTWDGNKNGNACPEGIYAFQILATGFEEQSILKNGTITLIR